MKPRLLSCLVLVLTWGPLLAQKPKSPIALSKMMIRLPAGPKAQSAVQLPFQRIDVVDMRFDTSKLGYTTKNAGFKTINLGEGVASGLRNWLQSRFQSGKANGRELVLVLRHLWMNPVRKAELGHGENRDVTENHFISLCEVRIDAFVKGSAGFQTLVRIDTVFESRSSLLYGASDLLQQPFDLLAEKISLLDIDGIVATRRIISSEELLHQYKQRLNKPRIESDTMVKGIYLTFNDFLDNRVTAQDFVVEKDAAGIHLAHPGGSEQRQIEKFWGFCDGNTHYIKIGHNFFQLYRDGNTYSFFGATTVSHRYHANTGAAIASVVIGTNYNNALQPSPSIVNILRPMQLDMETGKAR